MNTLHGASAPTLFYLFQRVPSFRSLAAKHIVSRCARDLMSCHDQLFITLTQALIDTFQHFFKYEHSDSQEVRGDPCKSSEMCKTPEPRMLGGAPTAYAACVHKVTNESEYVRNKNGCVKPHE